MKNQIFYSSLLLIYDIDYICLGILLSLYLVVQMDVDVNVMSGIIFGQYNGLVFGAYRILTMECSSFWSSNQNFL